MQSWAKNYIRGRLDYVRTENNDNFPRHLSKAYCCCQYAEEILLLKAKSAAKGSEETSTITCCTSLSQKMSNVGFDCCKRNQTQSQ